MRLGFLELLLIFAIILLLGGYKAIPKLTENVSKSIKMLKKEKEPQEQIDEKEKTGTDN